MNYGEIPVDFDEFRLIMVKIRWKSGEIMAKRAKKQETYKKTWLSHPTPLIEFCRTFAPRANLVDISVVLSPVTHSALQYKLKYHNIAYYNMGD